MPNRRQEKVARVIKEAVSDAIANHLNDPRITGFVSVTRVDMSADLRNSNVFLSIFGAEPKSQNLTFKAINHAKSRIQSLVAAQLQSRFCPVLHFFKDEGFKKTLEMMKLFDTASDELKEKDKDAPEQQS